MGIKVYFSTILIIKECEKFISMHQLGRKLACVGKLCGKVVLIFTLIMDQEKIVKIYFFCLNFFAEIFQNKFQPLITIYLPLVVFLGLSSLHNDPP